ncbi:MAG: DUF481 domain-containing protein, partial [Bacteroidota bacterium]
VEAQIVNIESRRSSLVDTSGWFGYLGLGANFVRNNRSITTISGDIRLEYLEGKSKILCLTNYNLIRSNQEKFIDNGFQHLRYNYHVNRELDYEIFTQAQFNNQIRIVLRGLLGTGVRWKLINKEKRNLNWGVSYMYEYDEIKIVEDEITIFRDHRMSTYLALSLKPSDANFSISSTTYYQPVLKNFSDVRLSSQTALKITMTSKLTFTSTFAITNDTRVPEDVPATYYSFQNAVRWNF